MRISNKASFQLLIAIFLGIITLSIIIMCINTTISCVDKNGCLRSWCKWEWLNFEYQLQTIKYNQRCPFQNTTGAWSYPKGDLEVYITGQ